MFADLDTKQATSLAGTLYLLELLRGNYSSKRRASLHRSFCDFLSKEKQSSSRKVERRVGVCRFGSHIPAVTKSDWRFSDEK